MNDHIGKLINGWLDQTLTAAEQAELEAQLLASPEARRQFWRLAPLHGFALDAIRLKWTEFDPAIVGSLGGDDFLNRQAGDQATAPGSAPDGTAGPQTAAEHDTQRSPVLGFLGGFWDTLQSSPRMYVLLLGGALAGYFLTVFALIPLARLAQLTRPLDPPQVGGGKLAFAAGDVVGTLSIDETARWAQDAQADSKARVGRQYALESGRVSAALLRGALVVIEGPAAWHFDSDAHLQFDAGQLAAYVPPPAVGFTVVTPSAEVLDLGTEFNLDVAPSGDTEVYVVSGKVALKSIAEGRPRTEAIRMGAGQAVRVTAPGDVVPVPFDGARLAPTRAALQTAVRAQQAAPGDFPLGQPIWLSNLFDDRPHVSLADAMRTDEFGAEADLNDLGVDRVIFGGPSATLITPEVKFDFSNLGWLAYGAPSMSNDASKTARNQAPSGLRVSGVPIDRNVPRLEDGICQTGSALITFNLDDVRAAGKLQGKTLEFVCDRAGINDLWVASKISSMHMVLIVSTSTGVSAAYVNGQPVEVAQHDGRWAVTSPIGEPLRGSGPIVSFRAPLAQGDKYITLAATCAGDGYGDDQAAWVGPRLEIRATANPK